MRQIHTINLTDFSLIYAAKTIILQLEIMQIKRSHILFLSSHSNPNPHNKKIYNYNLNEIIDALLLVLN